MSEIWVTSDWHFCHRAEFLWRPRGFESQYEMNKAIIERHNAIVAPEDDVYVLGDLMLSDTDEGLQCLKQLKGQIHIIRGNHDTDDRMDLYGKCWNVVEVRVGSMFLKVDGQPYYLSHYPSLTANWNEQKPLKKQMICLCGHSHTQDPWQDWDKGLIFHVEMDTNNCTPWNLNDIHEKITKKMGRL